jgi:hypothetical protein
LMNGGVREEAAYGGGGGLDILLLLPLLALFGSPFGSWVSLWGRNWMEVLRVSSNFSVVAAGETSGFARGGSTAAGVLVGLTSSAGKPRGTPVPWEPEPAVASDGGGEHWASTVGGIWICIARLPIGIQARRVMG